MRSELAAMVIALGVLACAYATAFSGDVDPPNPKTMNIDRAAGIVTVTYRNDEGAEVVERWKITSARFD